MVDDEPEASKIAIATTESISEGKSINSVLGTLDKNGPENSSEHPGETGNGKSAVLKEDLTVSGQREDRSTSISLSESAKVNAFISFV